MHKKTAESPPPFFPPVYTRFNPVRPAIQPYQFSAVLAFDLQDSPLRLRPLIVQNAPPAFGIGASDHFHLSPPPLHSGQANCYRSLRDHRYDIMPYMVMGAKVLINILRQHELDWVFITLIISHTAFTPILLTNNYLFTYSNRYVILSQ